MFFQLQLNGQHYYFFLSLGAKNLFAKAFIEFKKFKKPKSLTLLYISGYVDIHKYIFIYLIVSTYVCVYFFF